MWLTEKSLGNEALFCFPWRGSEAMMRFPLKTTDMEAEKRGEAKKSIEIAKNLKSLGVDMDVIAKGTGLSKDEIEKL